MSYVINIEERDRYRHAETAHNRIASVVVGFKEALLEEAEKKKDTRNWRIILQRISVNILVIGLLAASGYTVVSAVGSKEIVTYGSFIQRIFCSKSNAKKISRLR
uniref:Uncharacterized protein n=1 Tax=Megaselia scalaris TaxID=36166 RepID=T1GJ24_MEGSC